MIVVVGAVVGATATATATAAAAAAAEIAATFPSLFLPPSGHHSRGAPWLIYSSRYLYHSREADDTNCPPVKENVAEKGMRS